MWQRIIDCLGLAVRVRTNAAEIEAPLTGVLRTYADAAPPIAIDYVLRAGDPPQVERDGAVIHRGEISIDLIPAFERDLYRHVLTCVGQVALHAGAVVDARGRAVVFAGPSGAGKSTLIRGLLARGLRYLSEECVVMLPGRTCRGLARALNIEPGIAVPPGFLVDDYPLRPHPPGSHRVMHPPEAVIWRGIAETAAVIAIAHAPDAPDTLEPLGSGDALIALWPAMFRQTPDVLAQLDPAFDDVPLYRLRTRTPARAIELVAELLA